MVECQMPNSRRMKQSLPLLFFTLLSLSPGAAGDLTLWYRQPARVPMNEALPIGNGRLGGLVLGAPEKERLVVNEDSLWTGNENPSGDYDRMGAYQLLGEVLVSLPAHARPSAYRRDLDLAGALAHVSYEVGGVKYRREFFCSHPAGLLVARFTADRSGSYSGAIEVHDPHGAPTTAGINQLSAAGRLSNGLKYEWQIVAEHEGGTLQTNGALLVFSNCSSG
jgi:alpha-L-fucosidase 2